MMRLAITVSLFFVLAAGWSKTTLRLAAEDAGAPTPSHRQIVPAAKADSRAIVPQEEMRRIYEEVKTPFKYGIVLRPRQNESVDCPTVFRFDNKWYMVYVSTTNNVGYETLLAESNDLLRWQTLGKILPFPEAGWDRWQAAGGIALMDTTWGGSCELQSYDGKYWMSYIGGEKQGYEPDPLSIGMAWTTTPHQPTPWQRFAGNPVLGPGQPDARPFERATLYKSQIIWDKSKSLGFPFVMYYNAKQKGPATERIGMAVSNDLLHWQRYGDEPVIDNGRGISGDPQIVRIGDLWVMFYFGAGWKPRAFDTFACSYDLVQWTKWDGADLVSPSEPWDKTFAHKPWVLKHNGVVYHFYCAVGSEGRAIALATSKDMRVPADTTTNDEVYLFTSFRSDGQDGLQLLYSEDAFLWQRVPGSVLKPQVGGGLMRDPSLAQGPDGTFHLVWTTAWRGDRGFGYASSKDLVHWSQQRFIPVMDHEPTTVNVWAPELFYDEAHDRFIICWASTIPGRFPDHLEPHDNNQRMYYTTTRDFETFAPTALFFDPGFSVIDCTIARVDEGYVLVLKDNTRPQRNLRVAYGKSPLGPWRDVTPPFTQPFTEGPSVLKKGYDWIIYFDAYRENSYGAVKTRDFKSFTDISQRVKFPEGHKHGTVIRVPRAYLNGLLAKHAP